jgi:hypothetical protein
VSARRITPAPEMPDDAARELVTIRAIMLDLVTQIARMETQGEWLLDGQKASAIDRRGIRERLEADRRDVLERLQDSQQSLGDRLQQGQRELGERLEQLESAYNRLQGGAAVSSNIVHAAWAALAGIAAVAGWAIDHFSRGR